MGWDRVGRRGGEIERREKMGRRGEVECEDGEPVMMNLDSNRGLNHACTKSIGRCDGGGGDNDNDEGREKGTKEARKILKERRKEGR